MLHSYIRLLLPLENYGLLDLWAIYWTNPFLSQAQTISSRFLDLEITKMDFRSCWGILEVEVNWKTLFNKKRPLELEFDSESLETIYTSWTSWRVGMGLDIHHDIRTRLHHHQLSQLNIVITNLYILCKFAINSHIYISNE